MNFLAPSLLGLALFLAAASAAADPATADPALPPSAAPVSFAVRVVPSPWAAPSRHDPVVRRQNVKIGLTLGGAALALAGGAALAGGVYESEHPPLARSCGYLFGGCTLEHDKTLGPALLGIGAFVAAGGIAMATVGLALPQRRASDDAPRAALSVGPGSARVFVAF
jgi:hypothetical protein